MKISIIAIIYFYLQNENLHYGDHILFFHKMKISITSIIFYVSVFAGPHSCSFPSTPVMLPVYFTWKSWRNQINQEFMDTCGVAHNMQTTGRANARIFREVITAKSRERHDV